MMIEPIPATCMVIAWATVSLGAMPTADELLAKHATTVEVCLASFSVKSEVTIRFDDTKMVGERTVQMKPEIQHRTNEVRYDGRRFRQILHSWGDVGRSHRTKKDHAINSLISTNDFRASYAGALSGIGIVQFSREPLNIELARKRAHTWMSGSSLLGFLPSGENLDVVLRGNATLRPQTEQVNGSECYVIEGTRGSERYVVWIDPQHSYHMAKIHATSDRSDDLKTILAFKQVGDTWIPAETESKGWGQLRDPDRTKVRSRVHTKTTEFLIAPDHEALGSFAIDDFPNGARVAYHENGQYVPARFTWQDGRPVADVPQAAIDEMDKIAAELLSDADRAKSSPRPDITRVLDAYAATQRQLRSFVSKEEHTLGPRAGAEACEFRTDGERVRHQTTLSADSASQSGTPVKGFLWDGTYLIEHEQSADAAARPTVRIGTQSDHKTTLMVGQYRGAPLLGFLGGDTQRVDAVLRAATVCSLRQAQLAGQGPYELIEAQTAGGTYRVWFDPNHAYHIAQAEIRRRPQEAGTSAPAKIEYVAMTLDNVAFRQMDNVWVPVAADITSRPGYGRPAVTCHLTRTSFSLNPDHELLESFIINSIPQGTPLMMQHADTGVKHGYWKNRRPVWQD